MNNKVIDIRDWELRAFHIYWIETASLGVKEINLSPRLRILEEDYFGLQSIEGA